MAYRQVPAEKGLLQRHPRGHTLKGKKQGEIVDAVSIRERPAEAEDRAVFAIDIETCRSCGGQLRVIASIEEPAVIERILEHLGGDGDPVDPGHPSRAPPQGDLLV